MGEGWLVLRRLRARGYTLLWVRGWGWTWLRRQVGEGLGSSALWQQVLTQQEVATRVLAGLEW